MWGEVSVGTYRCRIDSVGSKSWAGTFVDFVLAEEFVLEEEEGRRLHLKRVEVLILTW